MRGADQKPGALFSYVSCEERVPSDHPLRAIRLIVDEALEVLSPEFEQLYSKLGRPSIPPEKLLRALLLQAFYTVRSERQLMQQLDYNLLFRPPMSPDIGSCGDGADACCVGWIWLFSSTHKTTARIGGAM